MKAIVLALAALIAAAGCGNRTAPQGVRPNADGTNAGGTARTQQTDGGGARPADRDIAARLEALAQSIPGVRTANCVVFRGTGVVGIDVDPTLDRAHVGTIKYSVAESLRKDPYGVNAIVTADADLAQRLRSVGDSIRNGRPIAGFADEMGQIVARIVPQLPGSISQPNASQERIQSPQPSPSNRL